MPVRSSQERTPGRIRNVTVKAIRFPWLGLRLLLHLFPLMGRGLRWAGRGAWAGIKSSSQWLGNGILLFSYSSRRLFTTGTAAATAAAIYAWLYLGWRAEGDALGILFVPALALSVLFSMNVLPRESEGHTMEIFFSLPVKRYRLVIWHLLTIAVWLLGLLLIPAIFLAPVHEELALKGLMLKVYPSLVCVSCLTLWISTYTRSGPAAGFVAGLICFLHLFQIRSFGPVQLFESPFLSNRVEGPMAMAGRNAWGTTQVLMLVVLCILMIYLTNERLKKSELWFR